MTETLEHTAEETAVIVLEEVRTSPSLVLRDTQKFEDFFAAIKLEIGKAPPDLSTMKGREKIASNAYKIRQTKAAIEKAAKTLTEDWRRQTTLVNAERARIAAELDAYAEEIRAPLTAWEEAAKEREANGQAMVGRIKAWASVMLDDKSQDLAERIMDLKMLDLSEAALGSFAQLAALARENAVTSLGEAQVRLAREEADRAELAKLRAEAAEREAKEAAEREAKAKADAEAKAAAEAEAQAKRDAEAKAAAEEAARKAEAERIAQAAREAEIKAREESERRAREAQEEMEKAHQAELAEAKRRADAAEAEAKAAQDKFAKERAEAELAAEAQREADRRRQEDMQHRADVILIAKVALTTRCGLTAGAAGEVVTAIEAGNIPALFIQF